MTRRLSAAATLATFLVALLLPSFTVTHAWNDPDLAGGVVFRAAGDERPAIAAPSRVAPADHCALCHWLRSLGQSAVADSRPAAPPESIRPRPGAWSHAPVTPAGDGCPARAPPALLA